MKEHQTLRPSVRAFRLFASLCALISLPFATTHAAKYAGEAFGLGVGARSLALGGAVVAGPFDGTFGYWNPAGLAHLERRAITAMHAETFGALLNHDFVSYTVPVADTVAAIDAYGFYFYYLGGGGIQITRMDPISGRPFVESVESHGDYLLAGSLARRAGKFTFGATARVFYRDIVFASGYGGALDAGALWQARPDTRVGLTVSDLSVGVIRYSTGVTETVTPSVRLGALHERRNGEFTARALMAGDIRFEGRRASAQFWAGDMSLDTHWGLELSYRELAFGRVGADIGALTLGAGVIVRQVTLDMAFLRHGDLDDSYRFSAGYGF